ncbi:ComEA family DNA-binding protein [Streptomyces sp. M19]
MAVAARSTPTAAWAGAVCEARGVRRGAGRGAGGVGARGAGPPGRGARTRGFTRGRPDSFPPRGGWGGWCAGVVGADGPAGAVGVPRASAGDGTGPGADPDLALDQEENGRSSAPDDGAEAVRGGGHAGDRRAERLPPWLQLRCGIEPRTLGALVAVLFVALAFAVHHFWTGRPQTVRAPSPNRRGRRPQRLPVPRPTSPSESLRRGHSTLIPRAAPDSRWSWTWRARHGDRGVPVAVGARVADALKAAGGARPGTDISGLNWARVLTDGEQIVVGQDAAPATGGADGAGGGSGGGAGAAGTSAGTSGAAGGQLGPPGLVPW